MPVTGPFLAFPMSFIGPELPSHLINPKDSEDDNEPSEKGPQIPAHLVQQSTLNIYDEDDDEEAGPSLPTPGPSTEKRQVGPTFPSYALTYDPTTYHNGEDDDDDDDFGPKPLPAGMQHQQTDAVKEFIESEKKRRKLAEVCTKTLIYKLLSFFMPCLTGCCQTQDPPTRRMDACPTIIVKSSWKWVSTVYTFFSRNSF